MNYQVIHSKIGDIGEIKENEKVKIVFTFKESPLSDEVKSIVPGCGCTKSEFKDGQVIAIFDVGTIPHHLKDLTKQNFKKKIVINYVNGTSEDIIFQGLRIRK